MARDLLAAVPGCRRRLYRLGFAVVPLLPLSLTRLLAYGAGISAWFVDQRGRRTVDANQGRLLPEIGPGARRRLVRRSFVNACLHIADLLRLPRLPRSYPHPARVRVVDPWRVLHTRPLPGPLIGATVHCNWELLPAVLQRLGYAPTSRSISRSTGDERLDRLFERIRSAHGNRSLLLDGAPLPALRALREGRLLGIVADRDYTGAGVVVPMAGGLVRLPVGPAALAVQTGAPIVPLALGRRHLADFVLVVGRPLTARPEARKADEVRRLTAELAGWFARFLRAMPSQWVGFHPYWEAPPGPRPTRP